MCVEFSGASRITILCPDEGSPRKRARPHFGTRWKRLRGQVVLVYLILEVLPVGNRPHSPDDDGPGDTDRYLVDETPDLRPSWHRKRDHAPDDYTVGYDPAGETRVGIGSAGGDVTRLVRHNEGRHRSDGNHSTREAVRDKKRITQSFCSELDVTPYQQREAVAAMVSLNLDRFGRQKRLEKVALATIKVIVEWDRFRRLRETVDLATLDDDQLPARMLDEEMYRTLLKRYGVSRADLYSTSQLVKRELKKRNHFGLRPRDPEAPSDGDADAATPDE